MRKLLLQLFLGFLHTPITTAFSEGRPVKGEGISSRSIRHPTTRQGIQASVDFAIQHRSLQARGRQIEATSGYSLVPHKKSKTQVCVVVVKKKRHFRPR